MQNNNLDVCIVTIDGRSPEQGQMINDVYTCVCYCIDWVGCVCGHNITKGEAFYIPAGEPYWFDGNFKFVMCGSPVFDPSQNHIQR